MLKTHKIFRAFAIITLTMLLFQIGIAASNNSGKTRKKSASKRSFFHNANSKAISFTSSNGFIYKGGVQFQKSDKFDISFQLRTMSYQKGDKLFVLPVKSGVILPKFSAPKKPVF